MLDARVAAAMLNNREGTASGLGKHPLSGRAAGVVSRQVVDFIANLAPQAIGASSSLVSSPPSRASTFAIDPTLK